MAEKIAGTEDRKKIKHKIGTFKNRNTGAKETEMHVAEIHH